jgi:hypothetical protein
MVQDPNSGEFGYGVPTEFPDNSHQTFKSRESLDLDCVYEVNQSSYLLGEHIIDLSMSRNCCVYEVNQSSLLVFNDGLPHHECLVPSLINTQPCFLRYFSNTRRFISESILLDTHFQQHESPPAD